MAERRKTTTTATNSKEASPRPTTAEIHADSTQAPKGPVQPTWTSIADSLPPAIQPVAVLVIGMIRALVPLFRSLWQATQLMGRSGLYILAMISPFILWAGSKWIQWYITSYVKKAQRVLSWVVWVLNFLPKSQPEA